MRTFDDWYDEVLRRLDKPTKIRNWTREGRYHNTRSTEFLAQTYRSMTDEERRAREWAGPNHPDDLILCSPLDGGSRWPGHERVGFRPIYPRWRDYRNGKISRKELGNPTPYLLSILKNFEDIME